MTAASNDGTRGEMPMKLTERHLELLKLLSQGYTLVEVASAWSRRCSTVKNCSAGLRYRLGARSLTHAVAIAKDRGLI